MPRILTKILQCIIGNRTLILGSFCLLKIHIHSLLSCPGCAIHYTASAPEMISISSLVMNA